MKKNTLYLFILLLITGLNTSCNYLDIVPDETATEKDAFANPRAALRYLYSCYGYLPQSNKVETCMDFTGDETISPFSESYVKFAEGSYDSSNTIISYWNTLFQGIRQCYLLKENINSVPKISQEEVDLYTAEADFLIAYFHLLLIKCYGPSILVKELPALDTPANNMLGRRPYDECIDWVADLLDDAATRLPATRNSSDYGRATSVIAKSLKARMLLYAASPLFNGNPDYADFKNPDGEQLMPTTYSEEKYKRAADATWDAIQAALGAGHELYKASTTSNAYPEPTNLTERTLRMTFMDSENFKEVIFPETRKAGAYGIQRKSIPFFPRGSWNGIAPTITMLDRFYTANGLPIDEDPAFSTSNKLDVVTIPEGITYAEPGKRTLYMNMNREPRFYAWIAFENGYYECRTDDKRYAYHKFWGAERSEGDKWLTGFLATENCGVRADDGKIVTAARSQNYSKTGYL
ncbi:RagB/SusD family nutrient uptake outer membrane protein, partial [Bacteroides thetaiotaomicron]